MAPLRLGILGSGKGSNFAAILRAIHAGELDAEIAIVISDVPGAGILALARVAGLAAVAEVLDQAASAEKSASLDGLLAIWQGFDAR